MGEDRSARRIRSDEPSWLHTVRDVVRDALGVDVDADSATLYLVALTEIIVNAEQIHDRFGIVEPAAAEIDVDRRQVTVVDHGGGFEIGDHGGLVSPDQQHGRGLHLAQEFCPELSASRTADGMRFTLPFPPSVDGISRRVG